MKFIAKLSSILDKISKIITVTLMSFLTILLFFSVVQRFVFNNPIVWQYEATLVCLSWVVFIGMSMTFRAKEHMAVTLFTNALKPKIRLVWLNIIDVVCIVFLLIGFVTGISIVKSTGNNYYLTLPFIKKSFFYLPFPIGCAMSIVQLINNIFTRDLASVAIRGTDEVEQLAKMSKEV